jgi:hypothetical protein
MTGAAGDCDRGTVGVVGSTDGVLGDTIDPAAAEGENGADEADANFILDVPISISSVGVVGVQVWITSAK